MQRHSHSLRAAVPAFALLCVFSPASAQNAMTGPASPFYVTVHEYSKKIAPPKDANSDAILETLVSEDSLPSKTVRITASNLAESQFDVSERIRFGTARSEGQSTSDPKLSYLQIGTNIHLRVERRSDNVVMEFAYHVARLANAESPTPSVKSRTVQITDTFVIGTPKLVSGLTADEDFYLVVTVTEPKPPSRVKQRE